MSDYRPDNFYSDDYEKLTYLYAEKPNIKPLRPGVFIPSSIRIENKYSRLDKYMSRLVLGEDFKEFFFFVISIQNERSEGNKVGGRMKVNDPSKRRRS